MNEKETLSNFSGRKLALPILIAATVSFFLIYQVSKFSTSADVLSKISFTPKLFAGLGFAFAVVIVRDLAYIYRIWELTDRKLSFKKCFEIIMLWEFGSSITPASVGGISVALYILYKEKINLGKSTSILLLTAYLDNLAFLTVFSFLFLILGKDVFIFTGNCDDLKHLQLLEWIRWVAQYAWVVFLIVAFTGGFLGFSIFIKPMWANKFLHKIAKFKWFNRWDKDIKQFGEEIETTSKAFKEKGISFMMPVFAATLVSWTARYALANALIYGFAIEPHSQLLVFSRQCVHRLITMIPLTPGGSGVMEATFMALNCDFLPVGFSDKVAVLWRVFNFWIYILIGLFILPKWLKKVSKNKPTVSF